MQVNKESSLRQFRTRQKLSVSDLARKSGIHRSTITRWESGQREPSLTELETVLKILSVSADERRKLWQEYNSPRALQMLRRSGDDLPIALGDLLRALRLRAGKSQTQVSQEVGITQGLLAKWENNWSHPDPSQLHSLCYLLGASAEEAAALTMGLYREQEPLPLEHDALYYSFAVLTYLSPSSHKDILFLAHSAQCLRMNRQGRSTDELLAQVWGRHAHFVQWRLHRHEDAIRYGEAALARLPADCKLDAHMTSSVVAVAQSWIDRGDIEAGTRFLERWKDRIASPVHRLWVQCVLARCRSEAGDTETGVALAAAAFQASQPLQEEYSGDFLARMLDYVALLLRAGDGATALDALEQHPTYRRSFSDHIYEVLLRAEAYALLGQFQEAASLFATAQAAVAEHGMPYAENVERVSRLIER